MINSRAVLDICHSSQSGLTMRTIESIGLDKKLITNNSLVKEEPFYTPDMITVFNEDEILGFNLLDNSTMKYHFKGDYSLKCWLGKILEQEC